MFCKQVLRQESPRGLGPGWQSPPWLYSQPYGQSDSADRKQNNCNPTTLFQRIAMVKHSDKHFRSSSLVPISFLSCHFWWLLYWKDCGNTKDRKIDKYAKKPICCNINYWFYNAYYLTEKAKIVSHEAEEEYFYFV